MPEKILGIDLGSSTLKVVQVNWNFRSVEVSGYASASVPDDADPSQVSLILKNLLSEHNLDSDRYVLALGTHEAFLRRLSFPFSAQRKIDQVIRFELEPSLPLAIEETLVDYVKSGQFLEGSQWVLAAALPRRVIDPLLTELREAGIVPAVVALDGSGLSIIADELRERLPERALILDIGHSKTNLMYRAQPQGYYLRALSFGCSRLAKSVASALRLTVDEGMNRVLSVGLDGPTRTPDDERAREVIRKEIQSLSREIEVSILAAQPQERESGPDLVVLTGGGSLIGGLAPTLEETLERQVRCLADFEDVGLFNYFRDLPSNLAQFATPAALALMSGRRAVGFNFQDEELRSRGPFEKVRQHLRYALVAGLLVGLSWLGSVGLDIYTKKQELKRLDKSIETVFRRTLPEFKGSARSAQYAKVIEARIKDLNQTSALFGGEAGSYSVVELLRAISQAIPASLDVTMNLLTVDSERIRIGGRADAFNTVDAVKNKLTELGSFSEVTIAGAKATPDGKGVQFSLDMRRKPVTGESS